MKPPRSGLVRVGAQTKEADEIDGGGVMMFR